MAQLLKIVALSLLLPGLVLPFPVLAKGGGVAPFEAVKEPEPTSAIVPPDPYGRAQPSKGIARTHELDGSTETSISTKVPSTSEQVPRVLYLDLTGVEELDTCEKDAPLASAQFDGDRSYFLSLDGCSPLSLESAALLSSFSYAQGDAVLVRLDGAWNKSGMEIFTQAFDEELALMMGEEKLATLKELLLVFGLGAVAGFVASTGGIGALIVGGLAVVGLGVLMVHYTSFLIRQDWVGLGQQMAHDLLLLPTMLMGGVAGRGAYRALMGIPKMRSLLTALRVYQHQKLHPKFGKEVDAILDQAKESAKKTQAEKEAMIRSLWESVRRGDGDEFGPGGPKRTPRTNQPKSPRGDGDVAVLTRTEVPKTDLIRKSSAGKWQPSSKELSGARTQALRNPTDPATGVGSQGTVPQASGRLEILPRLGQEMPGFATTVSDMPSAMTETGALEIREGIEPIAEPMSEVNGSEVLGTFVEMEGSLNQEESKTMGDPVPKSKPLPVGFAAVVDEENDDGVSWEQQIFERANPGLQDRKISANNFDPNSIRAQSDPFSKGDHKTSKTKSKKTNLNNVKSYEDLLAIGGIGPASAMAIFEALPVQAWEELIDLPKVGRRRIQPLRELFYLPVDHQKRVLLEAAAHEQLNLNELQYAEILEAIVPELTPKVADNIIDALPVEKWSELRSVGGMSFFGVEELRRHFYLPKERVEEERKKALIEAAAQNELNLNDIESVEDLQIIVPDLNPYAAENIIKSLPIENWSDLQRIRGVGGRATNLLKKHFYLPEEQRREALVEAVAQNKLNLNRIESVADLVAVVPTIGSHVAENILKALPTQRWTDLRKIHFVGPAVIDQLKEKFYLQNVEDVQVPRIGETDSQDLINYVRSIGFEPTNRIRRYQYVPKEGQFFVEGTSRTEKKTERIRAQLFEDAHGRGIYLARNVEIPRYDKPIDVFIIHPRAILLPDLVVYKWLGDENGQIAQIGRAIAIARHQIVEEIATGYVPKLLNPDPNFYLMESRLDLLTVEQFLEAKGATQLQQGFVLDLWRFLRALEKHGVQMGDLNVSNILVDPEGNFRGALDFDFVQPVRPDTKARLRELFDQVIEPLNLRMTDRKLNADYESILNQDGLFWLPDEEVAQFSVYQEDKTTLPFELFMDEKRPGGLLDSINEFLHKRAEATGQSLMEEASMFWRALEAETSLYAFRFGLPSKELRDRVVNILATRNLEVDGQSIDDRVRNLSGSSEIFGFLLSLGHYFTTIFTEEAANRAGRDLRFHLAEEIAGTRSINGFQTFLENFESQFSAQGQISKEFILEEYQEEFGLDHLRKFREIFPLFGYLDELNRSRLVFEFLREEGLISLWHYLRQRPKHPDRDFVELPSGEVFNNVDVLLLEEMVRIERRKSGRGDRGVQRRAVEKTLLLERLLKDQEGWLTPRLVLEVQGLSRELASIQTTEPLVDSFYEVLQVIPVEKHGLVFESLRVFGKNYLDRKVEREMSGQVEIFSEDELQRSDLAISKDKYRRKIWGNLILMQQGMGFHAFYYLAKASQDSNPSSPLRSFTAHLVEGKKTLGGIYNAYFEALRGAEMARASDGTKPAPLKYWMGETFPKGTRFHFLGNDPRTRKVYAVIPGSQDVFLFSVHTQHAEELRKAKKALQSVLHTIAGQGLSLRLPLVLRNQLLEEMGKNADERELHFLHLERFEPNLRVNIHELEVLRGATFGAYPKALDKLREIKRHQAVLEAIRKNLSPELGYDPEEEVWRPVIP